jgi:hypothetical protein
MFGGLRVVWLVLRRRCVGLFVTTICLGSSATGTDRDAPSNTRNHHMSTDTTTSREMLRHAVATLAYRAAKAMRGAPATFAEFRIGDQSRTPTQILAHMCDLFDWANWLVRGEHRWNDSTPGEWDSDVARFFAALQRFDDYLATDAPLGRSPELLFQGPVADALTHTGHLTMLRRLAGSPVRGESYLRADIAIGRVGSEQSAPRVEFD